jgi:hypothetical protein
MTTVSLDYVRGRIDAATYWAAVSAPLSLAQFCCGNSRWEEEYLGAVHCGFWRLHELDRASPFWNGTNRLATDSKLRDFADFELAGNPGSCDAARLAIAMGLLQGSGHLEVLPWRTLAEAGTADFRFLIFSAFASAPYWTDENIHRVVNLVRTLQVQAEVQGALQELAAGGEEQKSWAGRVTRALAA